MEFHGWVCGDFASRREVGIIVDDDDDDDAGLPAVGRSFLAVRVLRITRGVANTSDSHPEKGHRDMDHSEPL